jgi:hypothetical protein
MEKHSIAWYFKGLAVVGVIILVAMAVYGVQRGLAQTPGEVDKGLVDPNTSGTTDQTGVSSGQQADQPVQYDSSALDPFAQVAVDEESTTSQVDVMAAKPEAIPPGWKMNFMYFSGSAFKPRNSTYTYSESGSGGCLINTANPGGIYTVDLQLPAGAIIDIVRFFYYDADASNSFLFLTQYDSHGALTDIGYISSAGTAGFGDDAFYPADYVVDTYNYSLLLNYRPNVSGSVMQLCGARIRYWTPASAFGLPLVTK